MPYKKVHMKIYDDAVELLENNPGGLTFNELYQRLDRKYGNGRTLSRKFLGKVIGNLFKNKRLLTYKLDGEKILQLK